MVTFLFFQSTKSRSSCSIDLPLVSGSLRKMKTKPSTADHPVEPERAGRSQLRVQDRKREGQDKTRDPQGGNGHGHRCAASISSRLRPNLPLMAPAISEPTDNQSARNCSPSRSAPRSSSQSSAEKRLRPADDDPVAIKQQAAHRGHD